MNLQFAVQKGLLPMNSERVLVDQILTQKKDFKEVQQDLPNSS